MKGKIVKFGQDKDNHFKILAYLHLLGSTQNKQSIEQVCAELREEKGLVCNQYCYKAGARRFLLSLNYSTLSRRYVTCGP